MRNFDITGPAFQHTAAKFVLLTGIALLVAGCTSATTSSDQAYELPTITKEEVQTGDTTAEPVLSDSDRANAAAQSVSTSQSQTAFAAAPRNAAGDAIIGRGGTVGKTITPVRESDLPQSSIAARDRADYVRFDNLAPQRPIDMRNEIEQAQLRADLQAAAQTQGQSANATALARSKILRASLERLRQQHGTAALNEIDELCKTTDAGITTCNVN